MEEQEHCHDHGGGVSSNNMSKNIKKAIRKIHSEAFRSQVRRKLEGLGRLYYPTGFCLDANLDLLAFSNGVYDFTQKKFRAILPSDYISCENGLERTFPTEATEEAQKEFIQTFRPEFASIVAVHPNNSYPCSLCVKVICPRCKRQNSHGVEKPTGKAGMEHRVCHGCPFAYDIKVEEGIDG